MNSRPTVSVMMPNYNHASLVTGALDAIFAQSYQPLEVVVLDDASTDNSRAVLDAYALREPRLQVVYNERNGGVNAGLSKLVAMARGTHVFLPAADDLILPGFLQESMSLVEQYPNAGLCTTATRIIDDAGHEIGLFGPNRLRQGEPRFIPAREAQAQLLKHGSWMSGNTAIFHREHLARIGGHRAELGPYADGFAHEVLAASFGACYVPKLLAAWRLHAGTYSAVTHQDWSKSSAVREAALCLIRGEFKEVFPRGYAGRWVGRWHYSVVRRITRSFQSEVTRWVGTQTGSAGRKLDSVVSVASSAVLAAAAVILRPDDIRTAIFDRLRP